MNGICLPEAPNKRRPMTILMADDDPDDCMLTQEALEELGITGRFVTVGDGQELLDYLERYGPDHEAHPDLVLLDLNMPRMDGREALKAIKTNPDLKTLPVVVVSTSHADDDIQCSYCLGGNAYISKSTNFSGMVRALDSLIGFWAETVQLPPTGPCPYPHGETAL